MPSMYVQADDGVDRVGVSGSHNARHHGRHASALRVAELRDLLLAPAGPLTRVEVVDVTESTNTDLAADLRADPPSWPDASVLVAEHQTGGRGRAGSVLGDAARDLADLQLRGPPARPGRALRLARAARRPRRRQRPAGDRGRPGDPEVAQRPAGARRTPRSRAGGPRARSAGSSPRSSRCPPGSRPRSSSGSGSTCSQRADELPVPSATSLALAGAQHVDREGMLVALVAAQLEVAQRWRDSGGDAVGLRPGRRGRRRLQHPRHAGAGGAARGTGR